MTDRGALPVNNNEPYETVFYSTDFLRASIYVAQNYDTTYTVANNPTKEGYIFTGWTLSGSGTYTYYDTSVTPEETRTFNYNSATSTKPNAYNNKGNGTVTNEMVADSTATGGYSLKVVTNGEANPGAGGIYLSIKA